MQYIRTNNAIMKHVNDMGHRINWKTAECLVRKNKEYPEKIEFLYQKTWRQNNEHNRSSCYGKEGEVWFEQKGGEEQTGYR